MQFMKHQKMSVERRFPREIKAIRLFGNEERRAAGAAAEPRGSVCTAAKRARKGAGVFHPRAALSRSRGQRTGAAAQ